MKLLNITVSTSIAILYNLFVHHIISMLVRNMNYEDKVSRSTTFILISGVVGVVMSKLLFDNKSLVVKNGLWLGGILLIVTSIFVNWQTMNDEIKLLMIGITLFGLIWYSKHTLEKDAEED